MTGFLSAALGGQSAGAAAEASPAGAPQPPSSCPRRECHALISCSRHTRAATRETDAAPTPATTTPLDEVAMPPKSSTSPANPKTTDATSGEGGRELEGAGTEPTLRQRQPAGRLATNPLDRRRRVAGGSLPPGGVHPEGPHRQLGPSSRVPGGPVLHAQERPPGRGTAGRLPSIAFAGGADPTSARRCWAGSSAPSEADDRRLWGDVATYWALLASLGLMPRPPPGDILVWWCPS